MKSIAACFMVFSSAGFCQSAPPAFEVASVRRHIFETGVFGWNDVGAVKPRISGNRVAISLAKMQSLITFAYDVNLHQISGSTTGDTWGNFYDIEATTPGDAAPSTDQLRLMVRSLLTDRFQLKLHRDTATFPAYDLVIGKNGSKLKASAPDTPPSARNKNAAAAGNGSTDSQIEYLHQPVSQLVRMLSNAAQDRLFLDKTGLTGTYDFTLEYTLDPRDRSGAAQIAAVQEQLGLRLEAAQEPMDKLVIESVQEPSEN